MSYDTCKQWVMGKVVEYSRNCDVLERGGEVGVVVYEEVLHLYSYYF